MTGWVLVGLVLGRQAPDLPVRVDLRNTYAQYHLTVCNQSGPLCWDYTLIGLAEYELATQRHEATRLSPGFLSWAATATDSESAAGSNFGRAYRGLTKYGLAPLDLGGNPDSKGQGQSPDGPTLRAAADVGRFDFHWIRFWDTKEELSDEQLEAIESEVADGHPVAVGLRWPNQTSFSSAPSFMLKVPARTEIHDGHCVALVGYVRDQSIPGGGAFLFRNSWGENWADHGYAWMPFGMLRFCINDALSLRLWRPLSPGGSETQTYDAPKLKVEAVHGSSPSAQDMTGFGPSWGESRQLFFAAKEAGQGFTLDVPVEKEATYELRLIVTRAPDYGIFKVEVAGTEPLTVPITIDGAGPGVSRSNPIPCGRYRLKAGTNQIVFTVIGKGPASSGESLGIDSIELVPVSE